jgi:GTP-binding protein
MSEKQQIRNIAIIAHVDHGKTTLVDKMLRQAGAFRDNQVVAERVMDSNPLERERGITILAKNTAVSWHGTKINIVDTPGHADFGGEVERILRMVDGVLLVVDAFDGPMPQTRFVLGKALALKRTPIVVINKIDRPGADPMRVHDEILDLFIELEADSAQLDAPVVYASAREGVATMDMDVTPVDLAPLFQTIVDNVPAPATDENGPFQMLVSTIDHSPYLGRLAIGRIERGTVNVGDNVALLAMDTTAAPVTSRVTRLFTYDGLDRIEVNTSTAGNIVALAGLEGVEIGLTITDVGTPERLEGISVEEPTISVDFLVNNSPFAGKEGKFVTSRQLRERLYKELERNVALRVDDTAATDTWTVAGRGELHLTILMETMRREGYEFQVSRPPRAHARGCGWREAGALRRTFNRRARGVSGCGDREARSAPRRDDRDEESRAGNDPSDVPDSGAWTVRLSLGVSDRYSWDGNHASQVPGVRTVGWSVVGAFARNAGIHGFRRDRCIRSGQPRRAFNALRVADRSGVRGDDNRREFAPG